jgi:TatD DNase family protein
VEFIDTHSHIYLPEFKDDISGVMQRASGAGVINIILPNIDSTTIAEVRGLSLKFPGICIPLMGLHPTHVKENYQEELTTIFEEFSKNTYYGVGEIGIDLYWDKTYRNEQLNAFEQQLTFASSNHLPVVIHARESVREILEVLHKNSYDGLTGVFHAFTGGIDEAMEIIELGFILGIGGILTFKNSGLDETISQVSIKHIVLETDSPYLAPVPHRGKRNESAYVRLVAEKLADIHQISVDEVAAITTANATKLFNL